MQPEEREFRTGLGTAVNT